MRPADLGRRKAEALPLVSSRKFLSGLRPWQSEREAEGETRIDQREETVRMTLMRHAESYHRLYIADGSLYQAVNVFLSAVKF